MTTPQTHPQTPPQAPHALDAEASEPERLGWMKGFPPSPAAAMTYADGSFRQFPQSRWSFSNFRQFLPTRTIWRGPGPASPLPADEQDLGRVPVKLADGRRITFAQALALTYPRPHSACRGVISLNIRSACSITVRTAPSSSRGG